MCGREVIFGRRPTRGAEIELLDENLTSENQARKDRSTILGCRRFSYVSSQTFRGKSPAKLHGIELRWRRKRHGKRASNIDFCQRGVVSRTCPRSDPSVRLRGRGARRTYFPIDRQDARKRAASLPGRATRRRERTSSFSPVAVIEADGRKISTVVKRLVEYVAPEKSTDLSFLPLYRAIALLPSSPLRSTEDLV